MSRMTKDSERGKYSSPDGSATWEYITAMCCTTMAFCLGCMAGWNSPGLPRLMAPDSPVLATPSGLSLMMTMLGVGNALAPFLVILMTEKMGRKTCLLAVSIPTVASWGLLAVANHTGYLVVARFISGIAFGLGMSLVPMYLGEIASAKLRGGIGFVIAPSMNAGMLLMMAMVPYLSIRNSSCVCLVIAILSGIGMSFIPESPYYLAMIGKVDEAETALAKLRGKTDVREELETIVSTVRRQERTADVGENRGMTNAQGRISSYRRLLGVPATRKALRINMMFMVVIQFGGVICINIYGQIIVEAMKGGIPAEICTLLFAVIQLICGVLTTFVVDRVGRRPLMKFASIVSGGCTLVIGVYFLLMEYGGVDVTPYWALPLGALFVFMIATCIGTTPMQMVLVSETFSTEVKGLANFLIGMVTGVTITLGMGLYLNVAITWGVGHSVPFITFAAVTWIGTALVLRILPETKGKTLLEIQRDLST